MVIQFKTKYQLKQAIMKKLKFNLSEKQLEYLIYYIIVNSLNPEYIDKICQENNITDSRGSGWLLRLQFKFTKSELIDYLEEKLEINK